MDRTRFAQAENRAVSRLGGARRALVASLARAALGAGLAVVAAPATASDNPPAPDLDHFIPV